MEAQTLTNNPINMKPSMLAFFSSETVVDAPRHLKSSSSSSSSSSAQNGIDSFFSDQPECSYFDDHPYALMCYTGKWFFAASDDIFCLFQGHLDNAISLKKLHHISNTANHGWIVIEVYKAFKDKRQFLAAESATQFHGTFIFIIYDKTKKHVFVASGADGDVPLFWGIDSEEHMLLCDDVEPIKKGCGKSFAPFPEACLYTTPGGFVDLRDHFNSLPPELKGHILSYLTTEEGIRTRELAKDWIDSWRHSKSVDIDVRRGFHGICMRERRQKFENFVRWVVDNKIASLDSFGVFGSNLLELASIGLHRRACFRTLTTLHFSGVKFSDPDLVYNSIKNCSFLDEICLEDCNVKEVVFLWLSCPRLRLLKVNNRLHGGDGVCESFIVDAPKLEDLEYRGACSYISSFDAGSLHRACIHPTTSKEGPLRFDVASICNVNHLSCNYFLMDALVKGGELFPNLSTLMISLDMNKKTVGGLFKFLGCCINLENFHMVIDEGDARDAPLSARYIAEEIVSEPHASAIVANNLKSVDFIVSGNGVVQLEVAKFFLLHGKKLQDMFFSWTNVPSFNFQSENLLRHLKRSAPSSNFVKRRLI